MSDRFTCGEPIDIGHGVTLIVNSADGQPYSLALRHSKPDGSKCACSAKLDVPALGKAYVDLPETRWQVESLDPLTISPSVLCLRCGFHGYIRGGKWVPA